MNILFLTSEIDYLENMVSDPFGFFYSFDEAKDSTLERRNWKNFGVYVLTPVSENVKIRNKNLKLFLIGTNTEGKIHFVTFNGFNFRPEDIEVLERFTKTKHQLENLYPHILYHFYTGFLAEKVCRENN